MLTSPGVSNNDGFSLTLCARRRRHRRKARAVLARTAAGTPTPRPIMRLRLLPSHEGAGFAVGAGVEVMIEKIVVATPAEFEVTADVVMVVGGGLVVDEADMDVNVELVVADRVDEAEPEEVDELVRDVGGAVLEMKATVLAEPKSRTSALLLSQQFFLGSLLLSQHQESSGQC